MNEAHKLHHETLRHRLLATHLLEKGYDIRTIQELLGHKFVHTTMIYTHVASKNILGVRSPLEDMNDLPTPLLQAPSDEAAVAAPGQAFRTKDGAATTRSHPL